MEVGDKVYTKILGPEAIGTIEKIESNKNGFESITMTLDKPIKKVCAHANRFILVEEKK